MFTRVLLIGSLVALLLSRLVGKMRTAVRIVDRAMSLNAVIHAIHTNYGSRERDGGAKRIINGVDVRKDQHHILQRFMA